MADKPPADSRYRLRARWLVALACCVGACGDQAAPAPSATVSGSISQGEEDVPLDLPAPVGLPRLESTELPNAALRDRPATEARPRCDVHGVFCVHDARTDEEAAALLSVANGALATYRALGLPRLPYDAPLGGDARTDIYVRDAEPYANAFADPGSATSGFDEGTSFIVTPPLRPGCHDRQALAGAVARALLFGEDAALEPNAASMLGDYLAVRAEPCSLAELEAIDTAQRSPERTFTGERGERGAASFLFPWFLEDRYGTGAPGMLTFALAAISSQKTTKGPLIDEPDVFDALRVTQRRNRTSLAETLLEFAIHRAFIGSRSDETHMVDVAKYGDLGRVRIEWNVPYTSLPRTFKPLRPIEPLGATYLYIDLAGTNAESEITFVVDWEPPVGFRWAVVKIDESGSELGRKEYEPILGSSHLEATIRDLAGAKALLVVGINEGESRRDEPFDPGRLREAAKSYVITFAQ
ncbi:MAG: hypothetical protein HOW73_03730 [Polyangiaceae bacterium]|nr:hypothetical protein [Polyangiaceae bacterium]